MVCVKTRLNVLIRGLRSCSRQVPIHALRLVQPASTSRFVHNSDKSRENGQGPNKFLSCNGFSSHKGWNLGCPFRQEFSLLSAGPELRIGGIRIRPTGRLEIGAPRDKLVHQSNACEGCETKTRVQRRRAFNDTALGPAAKVPQDRGWLYVFAGHLSSRSKSGTTRIS